MLRTPFRIDSVASPATLDAGLRAGDEVVALNGERHIEFAEYVGLLADHKSSDVQLTVVRGDSTAVLTVPVNADGKIGVTVARHDYRLRTKEYTFWQSIPAGIRRTGSVIANYWEQLKLIVQPKTQMYEELGGFIAIGSIFPSAWNWQDFWSKCAFISIILAIMNILPIPGLDGGHAIFTLWEMITGRKPSDRFLEAAQLRRTGDHPRAAGLRQRQRHLPLLHQITRILHRIFRPSSAPLRRPNGLPSAIRTKTQRDGKGQKSIFLQGVRLRGAQMDGTLPRLRGVEHLHRRDRRKGERFGPRRDNLGAAPQHPAARRRDPLERPAAARPGQRRGQPGAGRRSGSRIARAAGRRTGHRQIDAQPANRTGRQRVENPLRLGRGVGRADQDARRPYRHRQRRLHGLLRDAARKHHGAARRAAPRPGDHRLDPDDLHRSDRVVGRQRVADPRMRRHAAQIRQGIGHLDLHHRPHHQGGCHRRPEDSGTHRRRGVAVRGRQQSGLSHPARHQEPFRRDVRDRRLRDARRRPAAGGQPLRNPARRTTTHR